MFAYGSMSRTCSNTPAPIIGGRPAFSGWRSRFTRNFRRVTARPGRLLCPAFNVRNGFQVVPWHEVAALFAGLAADDTALRPHATDGPVFVNLPARQFIRRLAYRLSPSLRTNIADALVSQARALRTWGRLVSVLARSVVRTPLRLSQRFRTPEADRSAGCMPTGARFADLAAPGDIMLMLSATLSRPNYGGLISRQCKAHGLRFAVCGLHCCSTT